MFPPLLFGDLKSQTLMGWLESKMRLETFYIWVKLHFQLVHVWCLERVEEGGGWKWLFGVWRGSEGGVLFVLSQCLPDRQVHSQMATPSADPCSALADAQLAPGAEQAGPCRPSGTAKGRDLWTRWSHHFCYLSVTLISSFCISSFAMCHPLSVFPATASFLCHFIWCRGYLALEGKEQSLTMWGGNTCAGNSFSTSHSVITHKKIT